MNCTNCSNSIPDSAKFCSKCGTKIISKSPIILEASKDLPMRGVKVAFGILLGLIVFLISFKIIAFVISVGAALGLGVLDINVSEDKSLLANIEAVANILGFVGAAILASKVYKRITRKNTNPNVLIEKDT